MNCVRCRDRVHEDAQLLQLNEYRMTYSSFSAHKAHQKSHQKEHIQSSNNRQNLEVAQPRPLDGAVETEENQEEMQSERKRGEKSRYLEGSRPQRPCLRCQRSWLSSSWYEGEEGWAVWGAGTPGPQEAGDPSHRICCQGHTHSIPFNPHLIFLSLRRASEL